MRALLIDIPPPPNAHTFFYSFERVPWFTTQLVVSIDGEMLTKVQCGGKKVSSNNCSSWRRKFARSTSAQSVNCVFLTFRQIPGENHTFIRYSQRKSILWVSSVHGYWLKSILLNGDQFARWPDLLCAATVSLRLLQNDRPITTSSSSPILMIASKMFGIYTDDASRRENTNTHTHSFWYFSKLCIATTSNDVVHTKHAETKKPFSSGQQSFVSDFFLTPE